VAHELETVVAEQVAYVVFIAREVIVDADHVASFPDKPVAQVRSDKTGSTGN
jgi:hypothetical protein